MNGGMDPNNRRCMIWDEEKQDLELFHFMKELISLRKTSPDLTSCDFTFLINKDQLLVYRKGNTYFMYNVGDKPIKFTLPSELQNSTVYSVFCNSDKHLREEFVIGAYKYFVFEK
jgi:glycosidase